MVVLHYLLPLTLVQFLTWSAVATSAAKMFQKLRVDQKLMPDVKSKGLASQQKEAARSFPLSKV
jgi:hypothetical protein